MLNDTQPNVSILRKHKHTKDQGLSSVKTDHITCMIQFLQAEWKLIWINLKKKGFMICLTTSMYLQVSMHNIFGMHVFDSSQYLIHNFPRTM